MLPAPGKSRLVEDAYSLYRKKKKKKELKKFFYYTTLLELMR